MIESTRGEGKEGRGKERQGGGADLGGAESVPAQCCQSLILGFEPSLNTSHINTAH